MALADQDRANRLHVTRLQREKQELEEAKAQAEDERCSDMKTHNVRLERELAEQRAKLEDDHTRILAKVQRESRAAVASAAEEASALEARLKGDMAQKRRSILGSRRALEA